MDTMKMINNVGLKSRIKQILILLTVILLGMMISHTISAQDFHRAKSRHFKSKYKAQIKWGSKACALLSKKRTEEPAKQTLSFAKSKPKYKPMAEVDGPPKFSNKSAIALMSKTKNANSQE